MRKLLLISVTALAVLLAASPASAGGWAATSLDAMPNPTPGEEVDVGFTIRAHGRTPVDVEEAGITTWSSGGKSGGKSTFWRARREGPTGHYVATVRFPAAGSYTWEVIQGEYGSQPLGTIEVPGGVGAPAPAPPAPAPVTVHEPVRMPLAVRLLLPAVAIAAGGLAIVEAIHGRRSRQQLAAA